MAVLEFKLDVFTGPLDLLLHLISKHQLNINDIEISKLLEQYLLYIEEAKRQDLELAGEFLEMAARLVWIKTVSLLPKPEEAERAKQELQGTLIEYALCQEAAAALRGFFIADDIFVRGPMKLPKMPQTYELTHPKDTLAEVFMQIGKAKMEGQRLTEKITDTVAFGPVFGRARLPAVFEHDFHRPFKGFFGLSRASCGIFVHKTEDTIDNLVKKLQKGFLQMKKIYLDNYFFYYF